MEEFMQTKIPVSSTVRGWEFIRFCRAVDLEEAVLNPQTQEGKSEKEAEKLINAISSLSVRLRRSAHSNVVDELPFFSIEAAYHKGYHPEAFSASSV